MITTMLHGASMALADSVPGVSGGTIAFILGFYERPLGAIHDFIGGSREERKQALRYLVKFAIGWAVGMGGSVVLLSRFFDSNIYFLSSMFLGLTLGAIPFILYQERSCLQNRWQNGAFTLLGIVLVVAMSFFRSFSGGECGERSAASAPGIPARCSGTGGGGASWGGVCRKSDPQGPAGLPQSDGLTDSGPDVGFPVCHCAGPYDLGCPAGQLKPRQLPAPWVPAGHSGTHRPGVDEEDRNADCLKKTARDIC